MAKLSKSSQYAIKYLHENNKTPELIAEELGLSVSQVEKFLASLDQQNQKTAPTKTDKTKDLMIRQTSAKKMNSVSIMTESASQVGDEFIKNMGNHQRNTDSYIFRPNK